MFGKKKEAITYDIWENGIPLSTQLDFGDYCFYVEEMLPYFIGEGGVALIQAIDANGEIFVSYEFFHMDGRDYQSKYMPGVPADEGFRFGVTTL